MKYMGSKNRIAKYILPIILKDRKPNQWYVEPFAGGMNMIDKVDGNRIANDSHYYLMQMWDALIYNNWSPPNNVSRSLYYKIKNEMQKYPPELVGWVGFCCSYSGKYFGGYANNYYDKGKNYKINKERNVLRNYQTESINSAAKQVPKLKGIKLSNFTYEDMEIPPNSIIYCDPPYKGTTKYKDTFDSDKFYKWCRSKSKDGHTVYVSEYNCPDYFDCIWQKSVNSQLSINNQGQISKKSTERLFLISLKD